MLLLVLTIVFCVGFYYLAKLFLINQSNVILNIIKIVLVAIIAVVAYYNYASIEDKIQLEKDVDIRNKVVEKRLEQIRDAQILYKKEKGTYAKNFDLLLNFLQNDSATQVKAIGEVPDSLLGQEAKALAMGIIIRDTIKIPVRDVLFNEDFDNIVNNLKYIPYTDKKVFTMDAGEVEKGKVRVQVFEAKAAYTDIYSGLKTDNEGIDMTQFMVVGSMEDPTTNGNWKD